MNKSLIRVLIVEDYEAFRRFVVCELRKKSELQIIGEVSDGLEAVRKAAELQPDLILLDIGLPILNGIETAREIRNLSPASKIIFVTQESSADLAQEALNMGARGYVVKADAERDLLAAVTAVLRGEQFVGSRFIRHDFTGVANLRITDAVSANAVYTSCNPAALRKPESVHCHEAQFYSNDEGFLDGMIQFIGAALKAESAVIVLATEPHRETLLPRLQAHGIDITTAIAQRRYSAFDSAEILSRFMIDDVPDPKCLFKIAGDLIDTASRGTEGAPNRVVACGELAPSLLKQGKPESAIQLERLWDQLVKKFSLDTLCAYSQASFNDEPDKSVFQRICAQHSMVHSL